MMEQYFPPPIQQHDEYESEDGPWIANPPDPTISRFHGIDDSSSVLSPIQSPQQFHSFQPQHRSPQRKLSFPKVAPLFKTQLKQIKEEDTSNLEVFSQEDQMKDLEDISNARKMYANEFLKRTPSPLTESPPQSEHSGTESD